MLELWYKEKRTLVDFRRGPIGPYFDGLAAQLKEKGYTSSTAHVVLGKCCLFNAFLIEQGITRVADLTESLAQSFIDAQLAGFRTSSHQYIPGNDARLALKHLLRYLVEIHAWHRPKEAVARKVYDWLLQPYLKHLREECELSKTTVKRCCDMVGLFLDSLGAAAKRDGLRALEARKVEAYVKRHIKESPENYLVLAGALRRFFRYCADRRVTRADFSGLLPPSHSYRFASLPKAMEDSALDRILKAINRDSPAGDRDYAIAVLMMAYGIRGVSAAELLLDDIDWQHSRIRIRAQKGGKEVLLPLVETAGDAIIAYLKHRPDGTPFREVFLTVKAPVRPLNSLAIAAIIQNYMKKAGVHVTGGGSRTLRHSWAVRALGQNSSIKAIADVLGHRYIDTTFIYAKADLKSLREVAMPWPEKG